MQHLNLFKFNINLHGEVTEMYLESYVHQDTHLCTYAWLKLYKNAGSD